jgi:hypothetical protein
MVLQTAEQGRYQDILEDFKARFSLGAEFARSSTASWAETDLRRLMLKAAENGPLFVEAFVNACSAIKDQGYDVPSHQTINVILRQNNAFLEIRDNNLVAGLAWSRPVPKPEDFFPPDDEPHQPLQPSPPDKLVTKTELPPVPGLGRRRLIVTHTTPKSQFKAERLRVFLCHSSHDKPAVTELYKRLKRDGYEPWLDAVDLLPGEDWDAAIRKAVRDSHVVVVCLSNRSINRAGYAQKEIKFALDVAEQQPEGR